jgi:probable addiction module antidote protein
MKKIKTRIFDTSEFLSSEEDMAAYLEAALSEGDPSLVVQALGAIAKARGMAQIAKDTGLRRESLYKALSPDGNPEFNTVIKVVKALGIRLHAETRHASGTSSNNAIKKAIRKPIGLRKRISSLIPPRRIHTTDALHRPTNQINSAG